MICSYCYKTGVKAKHDVSSWWNNSEGLIFVCSDSCRTELKKLLKDGKWMTHRPPEMFDKETHNPSPNFDTYD